MNPDTAQRTVCIVPRARCKACGGPMATDGDAEWCAGRCDIASLRRKGLRRRNTDAIGKRKGETRNG